jgi:phage terminase small subunit
MTGSRGPVSKSDDRRQRRNKRSPFVLGAAEGKKLKRPKPPKDLREETIEQWDAFWKTDLAKTMREEHLPMITRLFIRYDERERALGVIKKDGRLTRGSQGQLVLHPLMKLINDCESAILQLEDRLGISPRRGANAGGGAGGQGGPESLDDVNRRLNGGGGEEETDDEDPRDKVVGTIGR